MPSTLEMISGPYELKSKQGCRWSFEAGPWAHARGTGPVSRAAAVSKHAVPVLDSCDDAVPRSMFE